jgi:hypothetical protein
MPTACGTS